MSSHPDYFHGEDERASVLFPHLDDFGTCDCSCEKCYLDDGREEKCICPDCNVENCGTFHRVDGAAS